MKTIRLTAGIFTISAVLSAAVFAGIIVWHYVTTEGLVWLYGVLPATALFSVFAAACRFRLQAAGLIIENEILHIQSVEILNSQGGEKGVRLDVYVSCFGILAGTRIVRFNPKDKQLKSVEIGRDSIRLSYGNERAIGEACILHEQIETNELTRIVERFRFETGIEPIIKDC